MDYKWSGTSLLVLMIAVASSSTGCRSARQSRDPEYAAVARAMQATVPGPSAVAASLPPVVMELAGPRPVEQYVAFALNQHPEIQAARKLVEAKANRVPQAASLTDPMLGTNLYTEEVQTAAGPQQFAVNASQQVPWLGKLGQRAAVAEADVNVARAQLAAKELEVIEQVKRAYYELYFVQRAIVISERDRELLVDFARIAESRYRTAQVSQQDLLRAQVEVSVLDNELIRFRQQRNSVQARLTRLLHISPETPVAALAELRPDEAPRDLDWLYGRAVAARPELHAQLAAVLRDRETVDLARLDYFPDATFGTTWIATGESGLSPVSNGRDALLVGVNVNVPIYRRRLDAAVREAEAQVVVSARQYDSMRDRTAEEVKDLFVQATSQRDLLKLFAQEILPKAEQTLQVSVRSYEVGTVDFLTLIDNWRQLLRFQVAYHRLEAQLRQTLASLERTIGGPLAFAPIAEDVAAPQAAPPEVVPPALPAPP
jgi:outer membrane protein TolC